MKDIRVSKRKLLSILKRNRLKHRDVFLRAQEKYRVAVIQELDSMLAEARAGKKIRRIVDLIQQQDHTPDYDRVIKMAEMSVDADIELDETDFAQYVQDNWEWKQQFIGSVVGYLGEDFSE